VTPLIIRLFEPGDQEAARQLILGGLGEHFSWIDETCNPDLDDIQVNYTEPGHLFLIAEINGQVVGTGGLVTESETMGRIVRMSVDPAHRRMGIGRSLIAHLLDSARQKGLTQVRVTTDHGWEDAIGLYRHSGFVEIRRDSRGLEFSLVLGT
jgi:ribosomal protein S18 acetylase RimI-like enzyme